MTIVEKTARLMMKSHAIETAFSDVTSKRMGGNGHVSVSKGDKHPDKIFYVIRRPNEWGLMSVLYTVLRYIDYAQRRKYIPVVDMETVHTLYLSDEDQNKGLNVWEYFFEQPCDCQLADISDAKHIIYSCSMLTLSNTYGATWHCLNDPDTLTYWQKQYREYIRIKPDIIQYIDEMRNMVFHMTTPEETLGVYCRGTDYTHLKPKNHNIQPEPETVIQKVNEALQMTDLRMIYLVTEDEEVEEVFRSAFRERLLLAPVKRYRPGGDYVWRQTDMLSRSRKLNGMEYLASMKLLAECKGFVGGVTGGTAGMMLMKDGLFEYQYFFNLGVY